MSAGTRGQYSNQVLVQFYGEFKPEDDPEESDALDAMMEDMGADFKDVPYRNTVRLMNKGASRGFEQRRFVVTRAAMVHEAAAGMRAAFNGFWNEGTRVYLIGHGYWQEQFIGTFGAGAVARMLVEAGMPKVKIISVVSCELGQGGFAQALQRDLFEFGQIKATLYTRNLPVRVDEAGFKETYLPGSASEFQPKRMGAKAEWFWQGNSQLSRPVAARVK